MAAVREMTGHLTDALTKVYDKKGEASQPSPDEHVNAGVIICRVSA
jgi:hypothetical protein